MMAHELLRQAAQILGAGWSKGSTSATKSGTNRTWPACAGKLLTLGLRTSGAGFEASSLRLSAAWWLLAARRYRGTP
jgi:hypothetical protein